MAFNMPSAVTSLKLSYNQTKLGYIPSSVLITQQGTEGKQFSTDCKVKLDLVCKLWELSNTYSDE